MKNYEIIKRSMIFSLMGFTTLFFFIFLSISNLKRSHFLIDTKYKKELETLETIGVGMTNEPFQDYILQSDQLLTLFSSSDFYCVSWSYDRTHAGGYIKNLPSKSVSSYEFIYSENEKGDRLYYATSADGSDLYYYKIHLPDAKVAKYFTIMIRRDCIKK